jgi:hypothetical protein
MNTQERTPVRSFVRFASGLLLALAMLSLSGCTGSVGVGVSVGVPVGSHGYMSVGGSRWY